MSLSPMSYLALARKWRPKRFDQLVGQPHVVQSLTHALTQNKIHHAYLFTGTHGIGKTTLARIFAKCLNCEKGITATPCETCSNCQEIDSGRFPDLFEIDAASRTKVEDTRELLDNIPYSPTKGRFKVYLIDEVHMLSGHSFNALLKTLEEPPAHVKFLLATTDPQKLPATVLSRCLQFHLAKMTAQQIENQLSFILQSEKITFEEKALSFIAQAANGSMRDSLTLLDQCIAHGNGKVLAAEVQAMLGLSNHAEITALLNAIHQQDAQATLALTANWANNGVHFSHCLSELLTQLHQLTIKQLVDPNYSSPFSPEEIQLYYQIALIGQRDLPLAPTPQIGFEMIALRMMAFTHNENVNAHIAKTAEKAVEKTDSKSVTPTEWHLLLPKLNLTGPTLALAQHCALQSMNNNTIALVIQKKFAALLNDRQKQRIAEAIQQVTQQPITLTISIEETALETPAHIAVRTRDAQKQSAKKSISADATIKKIVENFEATVVEDSIEPTH